MVSFQQILKVGENIKIDICKCPINVELVKKSSNRPGHLQMPFQIHLLLCVVCLLNCLWFFASYFKMLGLISYCNLQSITYTWGYFTLIPFHKLSQFPHMYFLTAKNRCCFLLRRIFFVQKYIVPTEKKRISWQQNVL